MDLLVLGFDSPSWFLLLLQFATSTEEKSFLLPTSPIRMDGS